MSVSATSQGALLVNLQARLLVVDAKHRLTAQQALQHPWMQVHALFSSFPYVSLTDCLLPLLPRWAGLEPSMLLFL